VGFVQQLLAASAGTRLLEQYGKKPATKESHTHFTFFLYALIPGLLEDVISSQAAANLT
jgi:hypothetical protein